MIGECPTCGAPVWDVTGADRRDDRLLADGRTESLLVAEPCGHDVLVRSSTGPLDDPELIAP